MTDAREQSGFIGITQSPNIWVSPVGTQGVRRIDTSFLPRELRERPSTSLAFEIFDQPFALDLAVEPAPPLVRAETKAIFWIDPRQVRSKTTIELQWVRGRLFEVELGVAAGLQVVSVGPPGLIESSSLSFETGTGEPGAVRARRLRIRLTPLAREPNKIALRLDGVQRIASEGPVKLGLFTRDQSTSVNASYALIAGSGLSVELDDESGLVGGSSTLKLEGQGAGRDWPAPSLIGDASAPPLVLTDDGTTRCLPIRITRQARSITQDTALSAQVTRHHVEVLQQTSIAVHFGVVGSVEIRVPAAIGDRWELLDKEIVDRQELGKVADGSRRFRLAFGRPLSDRTTLRFRYRLPLVPSLEARAAREVSIPSISFLEGRIGPATVELSLTPEILLEGIGSPWIRFRG